MPPEANIINEIITKGGIFGLMSAIIGFLLWYIDKRTVPKLAYDQKTADLTQMRAEMSQLVGPALDRFHILHERQLSLQEEMWRRLESHSETLSSLSQEVKQISRELHMRRLEGPREPVDADKEHA